MENSIKENVYRIIQKLKSDKKAALIILIGVIGMLLITVSEFSGEATSESLSSTESFSYDENKQKEELEEIIGEISGVGRVKVMITYECSRESVFASDTTEQTEDKSKKMSTEYIIVDSGSEEEGLLLKEVFPKVMGVAVVCEGGDSPTVKNEITMLIKAIFDLSSNNICISEMQK